VSSISGLICPASGITSSFINHIVYCGHVLVMDCSVFALGSVGPVSIRISVLFFNPVKSQKTCLPSLRLSLISLILFPSIVDMY